MTFSLDDPAVVLQWVAETRAKDAELNRLNNVAIDQSKEASAYADKLRMAVEAMEQVNDLLVSHGDFSEDHDRYCIRASRMAAIELPIRTALDEIKKLSGGQGE